VRLFARLVIAGLIAGFAIGGYAAYRIWDQGNRDERTPADAIVVMGAAQYDGRPSPVFAARLDHAGGEPDRSRRQLRDARGAGRRQ